MSPKNKAAKKTAATDAEKPEVETTEAPVEETGPMYYEIATGEDWRGCAELVVTLPSGGKSHFNTFQDDPQAEDYPAVRAALLAHEVANYRGQGFTVEEITAADFNDLEAMSDRALWLRAFGHRIRLGRQAKREDLIAAIQEAEAE